MINTEELLEKSDLTRLAERAGAKLRKRGAQYRSACPLHGGDNASAFVIYQGRSGWRWHCYTGCNDGGDAIEFIRRQYNLPPDGRGFIDACKILADESGIDLPGWTEEEIAQHKRERAQRNIRREVLQIAVSYYEQRLWSNEQGLAYARGRGWEDETIKALRMGYSDGHLVEHLIERGADLGLAAHLGLLTDKSNGAQRYVDAIPGGYLIYTHQLHHEILYLSGRATFTNDKAKKSRNLHTPKQLYWAIQRHGHGPLLMVEGQACASTLYQWGYNSAGLGGTSLDDQDVRSVQAYPGVYLILDPDAQDKIAAIADKIGPLTMIVEGLPGADINDWAQNGGTAEVLATLMEKARPWIEVAIAEAVEAPPFELEEHLDHLAHLITDVPQGSRGQYIYQVCTRHKLATKADFKQIVAEIEDLETEANGFEVRDGRISHYGDPLCNMAIYITHELTRDDGLNIPEKLYTITATLDTGEQLRTIDQMPAEDFDKMSWIGRNWGARAIPYVSPGKYYTLKRAIQEVSRFDLTRERIHTYTGWTKVDGEWRYLTTTGGVGVDGLDVNVRVDLGINNLSRYALPKPPADLRRAIRASLDFIEVAPLNVTIPLITAMYAAPLSPIRTLDAVLWVYGQTQSGKSTISHLALTHFGPSFIDGHQYRAPVDWMSTVTGIEGALFAVKDAPVIVDDYAPQNVSASQARSLGRTAQRVIRSVGNRSARSRAKADLSEQTNRPPRGLVISTAENPIIGQSTVGRTIYVPVDPGSIIAGNSDEENKLDKAQKNAQAGLYAHAMGGYIQWLAGQWDHLMATVPEEIELESRAGRTFFPARQSRLADYYALLAVALRQLLRYAAERGVISDREAAMKETTYKQTLIDLLRSQGERVASQSPTVKFWNALNDLLAQEEVYFAPRLETAYIAPEHAALVGWYDEDHVYLLTNAALKEVKSYWSSLDERLDILSDAFRRILQNEGYVARRADSQLERKTYINTEIGRTRTLWLDRQAVEEKGGVFFD